MGGAPQIKKKVSPCDEWGGRLAAVRRSAALPAAAPSSSVHRLNVRERRERRDKSSSDSSVRSTEMSLLPVSLSHKMEIYVPLQQYFPVLV